MSNNFGLGRGLSSLIPPKRSKTPESPQSVASTGVPAPASAPPSAPEEKNNIQEIDVARIVPNPHQPRRDFHPEKMQELSDSIKQHGIIQPLVLTKNGNQYEIIAGERRLQAAKMAGLGKIPAIVRDATEQQKLELAIIENIQRHDLNPVEEARSYLKLTQEFGLTQEEVAAKIGKSRPAVANKLRILNLPVEIQKALISGKITEGHAKAILALENPEKQRALYEMIIKSNLTVRQAEDKTKEISVKTHKRTVNLDPEIKKIESDLSAKLGTKVKLTRSGPGGRIIIDYYSKEELSNLISKIC
jgi:ParB family chromosome partitioning protein